MKSIISEVHVRLRHSILLRSASVALLRHCGVNMWLLARVTRQVPSVAGDIVNVKTLTAVLPPRLELGKHHSRSKNQ